jgi:hypothetical protein
MLARKECAGSRRKPSGYEMRTHIGAHVNGGIVRARDTAVAVGALQIVDSGVNSIFTSAGPEVVERL